MSIVWKTVDLDASKEDQVQDTLDETTGAVTSQLIQTWLAITDGTSRADPVSARSAQQATGSMVVMPAVGSYLSTTAGLYQVTRVLPKRTGPYSFEAQVEAHWKYTPPLPANKSNITISFSGQKFIEDAHNDSTGTAVVNSAGQYFDPSVPITRYDERISISYITASDQSAAFAGVRGCVNNNSLSFSIKGVSRTFPNRGLLCEDVKQSSTFQISTGALAFNVTADFLSRSDTYTTRVADRGMYQLSSGTLVPILDASGKAVSTPVNLNGSGGVQSPQTNTPNFLTFKMEPEADFTSIFSGLS